MKTRELVSLVGNRGICVTWHHRMWSIVKHGGVHISRAEGFVWKNRPTYLQEARINVTDKGNIPLERNQMAKVYTVKQNKNGDWCVYADGKEVAGAEFNTRRAAIQEMSRLKTGETAPAADAIDEAAA